MKSNLTAQSNPTASATAPLDFGVRFSLSGMFWLFVVISLMLLICTLFRPATIVCVPLTIAGIRTSLMLSQRARLGFASSVADCLELFWGAVLMTLLSCISLGLAAIWGFSFGAAVEYLVFSGSRSYLLGGAIGAVLAAAVMPFAWWRTIQSNWVFDLQAKKPMPDTAAETFSTNHRLRRFHFDLATVFEVTTYFAVMLVVGSNSLWLLLGTAFPFAAAIVSTARFASRKRQAGESVLLLERYKIFVCAAALGFLLLLSVPAAFAGGYFAFSQLAAFLFGSHLMILIFFGGMGGVIFVCAMVCAWVLAWQHRRTRVRRPAVS